MEELQNSSSYLPEEIFKTSVEEKEPDLRSNHFSRSSALQERAGYIPSVFRGINTTGSYHVYGDLHVPAGTLEASHKMAFPCSIIQPAAAHSSLQGPAAPLEGDNVHHPQTGCLRLSPSCSKGVICSPQSPLRSDCQPNSPTESSSSINANMSLQPSDCPRYTKARNWKKYKFIVLNQTLDESGKEAQRGGAVGGAASPSLSPSRSEAVGGHSESQGDDGSQREDTPSPRSELSCSSR